MKLETKVNSNGFRVLCIKDGNKIIEISRNSPESKEGFFIKIEDISSNNKSASNLTIEELKTLLLTEEEEKTIKKDVNISIGSVHIEAYIKNLIIGKVLLIKLNDNFGVLEQEEWMAFPNEILAKIIEFCEEEQF